MESTWLSQLALKASRAGPLAPRWLLASGGQTRKKLGESQERAFRSQAKGQSQNQGYESQCIGSRGPDWVRLLSRSVLVIE